MSEPYHGAEIKTIFSTYTKIKREISIVTLNNLYPIYKEKSCSKYQFLRNIEESSKSVTPLLVVIINIYLNICIYVINDWYLKERISYEKPSIRVMNEVWHGLYIPVCNVWKKKGHTRDYRRESYTEEHNYSTTNNYRTSHNRHFRISTLLCCITLCVSIRFSGRWAG